MAPYPRGCSSTSPDLFHPTAGLSCTKPLHTSPAHGPAHTLFAHWRYNCHHLPGTSLLPSAIPVRWPILALKVLGSASIPGIQVGWSPDTLGTGHIVVTQTCSPTSWRLGLDAERSLRNIHSKDYVSLGAAGTNHHKPSNWKQQKCILSQSGRLDVQSQGVGRWAPSGGSGICCVPISRLLVVLAFLGVP